MVSNPILEDAMSNKRGKVYVDRYVQGALARRLLVHWCVFFLVTLLSLFASEYFLGDPNLTATEHLGKLWSQYAFFILLMLAIVPTFIYDTMKLSNRFAGPILRLQNSIKKLADGEPVPDIKFREHDFWLELGDDFNRLSRRVTERPAK